MIRLAIIIISVMPLVASIICIVKHPVWVGILGVIGSLVHIVIYLSIAVLKRETIKRNIIDNSSINVENGSFIQKD